MSSRARKPAKKQASAKPTRKPKAFSRVPTRYVRGYGDYKKGPGYGSRLGQVLGEGADILYDRYGSHISSALLGFGDYVQAPWAANLKSNTLAMGLSPPEVVNTSMKNVIIRHREYLGDVITGDAGTFNNTAYSINPGIVETFPWLSQVAMAFEQYKLRGMVFEFKSASADALNSTNTALGTVIMATEYDSTRPDFASKQQMENHQYAMSARQSCSMLHPIECARSENVLSELYVRNGLGDDDDIRFTDFGKFQIATMGQQGSAVNIGELWCSYEVEFLKPRFGAPSGSGSVYSEHLYTGTGISNTAPLGGVIQRAGNIGLTAGGNSVQFPDWLNSGQFLCLIHVRGNATAVNLSLPTLDNCEYVEVFEDFGSTWIGSDDGTTTYAFQAYIINITAANASITYNEMTWPASATWSDFVTTSWNPLASNRAAAVAVKALASAREDKPAIKEELPDIINRLLESGKSLSELQKLITDQAFEAMKDQATKEFKNSTKK